MTAHLSQRLRRDVQLGEVLSDLEHFRVAWQQSFVLDYSVGLQREKSVRKGLACENFGEIGDVALALRIEFAFGQDLVKYGKEVRRLPYIVMEGVESLHFEIVEIDRDRYVKQRVFNSTRLIESFLCRVCQ